MRIFADIATHDSTGVAPGGRIIRTDSTPVAGTDTPTNGQFVFTVPEGAALEVDSTSFWFPQDDLNSIPSQTAAEFLVRYPMYDHILYNFYLDNVDVTSLDLAAFATLPASGNTTPALLAPGISAPASARCQLGRGSGAGDVGMVPNSLALSPASAARASNVYGCILTTTIDLWDYNPCYIDVTGGFVPPTSKIFLAGFPLESVNGARTPGNDDFNGNAGSAIAIATDIAAAINDAANSFSVFVVAVVDPANPTRIELRPIPATFTGLTLTQAANGISVVESHPGTDEVMMWWKVSESSTTEDQGFSNQGATAGLNDPAVKSLVEIEQEPAALRVYASVDDGVSWFQVPYLEPIDLVSAGTELRLCFVNLGSTRTYLHGFCVLFPDLPAPL
jgi:hypothetical protein